MIGPRKVDRPLVLYGFGKLGHLADEIFNELKIPIAGVLDRAAHSEILDMIDRQTIKRSDYLLAICVATEPYNQVIAPLVAAGWTDIVPVWDIIEAYPEVGISNGWFAGECTEEDEEGIISVMDKWRDKVSSLHYLQFRHWAIGRQEWISGNHPPEIIGVPLPSTLADIRLRQRVLVYAANPTKKVHLHSEGCELKELEVNMPLFQKHRPSISVACYHSRDGLYKIEKFLMDNLPDYTWTFRLTAYMGQGAYISGTSNERGE